MTTFRYGPAYVPVELRHKPDQTLYEIVHDDHAQWLALNEIAYAVVGFRWPEIITMLFSHDKRTIGVEFDLTIDDDTQAVMFRLYSGLKE
jgi:hypothetical protein